MRYKLFISELEDLAGDVKKLTGKHPPVYRLRAGNHRILFGLTGDTIEVHRVKDRRDAYDE